MKKIIVPIVFLVCLSTVSFIIFIKADDLISNEEAIKIGEEKYNLSDGETYNIFKTKKTTNDNFLKYDDEYGKYDGDEAFDLIEKKEIDQNKDN